MRKLSEKKRREIIGEIELMGERVSEPKTPLKAKMAAAFPFPIIESGPLATIYAENKTDLV